MSDYLKIRLILGVIVLVGVGSLKFCNYSSADADQRAMAHRLVAQAEGYGKASEYYDFLADYAHDEVFSGSYVSGGRYSSGHVNQAQYRQDLFDCMIDKAQEDNSPQVVAALEALQARLEGRPVPKPQQQQPKRR